MLIQESPCCVDSDFSISCQRVGGDLKDYYVFRIIYEVHQCWESALYVLCARMRYAEGDWMYTLVLVRHGESEWNRENRFTGWTDVDLSPKGVDENENAVKAAAEAVANRGKSK